MAERVLVVRMLGDSRQLEQSFTRSSKAAQTYGRNIAAVNKENDRLNQAARGGLGQFGGKTGFLFGSSAFIGAAAVTGVAKAGIEAASNLNEQISKSNVVFGQSSRLIQDWAHGSARNMGLARDQAIETAASFGALFKPLGIGLQDSIRNSEKLTQLGADLASFYNTDVADALTAIRSGLVGEVEPLRRYGVLLSEARVQARALADTGKTNASQLTAQEKVLARLELIYKDTAQAQGDFQRTSSGYANQLRIAKANVRDLESTLGQVLLPTMTSIVGALNDGAEAAQTFSTALGNIKVPTFLGGQGGRLGSGFQQRFKVGLEVGNPVAVGFQMSSKVSNWLFGGGPAPELPPLSARVEFTSDFNSVNRLKAAATAAAGNAFGQPGFKPTGGSQDFRFGPTVTQRNTWFDAAIGRRVNRASYLPTLNQQIAALKEIAADIQKRMDATKDITRRLKLEDDLLSVQAQIAGDVQQQRSDSLQAAADARQKALEAAQKAAENRQKAQFALLGLDASGSPLAPGRRALTRLYGRVEDSIKGTFLDTSKTRSLMGNIRRLLSGQMGALGDDVRRKLEQILHNLDNTLKNHSETIDRGRLGVIPTSQVLGGLGLSAAQLRIARARLSGVNAAGALPLGTGAFGIAIQTNMPDIVVQSNLLLDGAVVGASTTRHQQRRRKRTAAQRGGRNPGTGVID